MSAHRPPSRDRSFPAVGDADRFEQIVRRGRTLRRRRRAGIAAGSGGGVAAVAVAVVLLTGGSPRPDQSVVADQNGTPIETTTTTTTTAPPQPTVPDALTVEVDADPDQITVVVTDPRAPVAEDSRQCVTVSLLGDRGDTAEATACDDIPAVDGVVTVDLPSTDGALIGCAATLVNPSDSAVDFATELRSTTFALPIPADLDPDTYSVEVGATSGIGDGCVDTGDEAPASGPFAPGATETATRATATFTLG